LCADDEEDGRSSIRVRVDKGTLVYGDQVFYRNDAVIMTMARTDDQTFGTIQSIGASEVGGAGQHGHIHCHHRNPPFLTTLKPFNHRALPPPPIRLLHMLSRALRASIR
jgi:hypothetical protein